MNPAKAEIRAKLAEMIRRNQALIGALTDRVALTDYAHLVREGNIWTDALQTALHEHEVVVIPASDTPYMIDNTVTIPSGRRIEAEGATIRLCEGVRVLMLRNEHTQNGSRMPITRENRDTNISISGGVWEEFNSGGMGHGKTGFYDEARSFPGVSTCMLFNNLDHLSLTGMTFLHANCFAVQMGDITDVHCEDIEFVECHADGLHINGNTENVLVRNVRGFTGDDLVALNMYDWQIASVNFGPANTILCEDLHSTGGCRAMRLLPGVYQYEDGSTVDCSLTDVIISRVDGINEYKLYLQTPAYRVGSTPERGEVGSGGNIFFEHIRASFRPSPYCPVPFEINSNIDCISMEDLDFTLPDGCPLIAVGPKSALRDGVEVFDPYLSSTLGTLSLKNIRISGSQPDDIAPFVHEVIFDHLYEGGPSTGRGTVCRLEYEK